MTLESLEVKKLRVWMSSLFFMQLFLKKLLTNKKPSENVCKRCVNVMKTSPHISLMTPESQEVKNAAYLDEFTVSYAAFA